MLYRADGKLFEAYGDLPERKVHFLPGKEDGEQNGLVIIGTVEQFNRAGCVWICEGVTDALAVASVVDHQSVSVARICGATSWPKEWNRSVFSHPVIKIVGDNEQSNVGRIGAMKAANVLM